MLKHFMFSNKTTFFSGKILSTLKPHVAIYNHRINIEMHLNTIFFFNIIVYFDTPVKYKMASSNMYIITLSPKLVKPLRAIFVLNFVKNLVIYQNAQQ